jgi:hypothetical protein
MDFRGVLMAPVGTILLAACVLAIGALAPSSVAQDANAATGRSEASLAPGTAILAELNSAMDSKKAKVGDAIAAHTTETLKSADDRTILPRGTKIEGHITQSAARGKGGDASALGIQFDKAKLKDGGEITLNVIIQALAAPVSFAAPTDLGTPPTVGTTQTSPMSGPHNTPPVSQAPAGGGMPDSNSTPSARLDGKSRGAVGLHGVTLNAQSVNNRPASVVASNGKSVHLDSGTQMLLVVQGQEAEPPGQ